MNKVIQVMGALVLAILFTSVQVFFGIAIAANWCPYIRLLLGIGTIGEICVNVLAFFEAEEKP